MTYEGTIERKRIPKDWMADELTISSIVIDNSGTLFEFEDSSAMIRVPEQIYHFQVGNKVFIKIEEKL